MSGEVGSQSYQFCPKLLMALITMVYFGAYLRRLSSGGHHQDCKTGYVVLQVHLIINIAIKLNT